MADTGKVTNIGLGIITALLASSANKHVHWGTGATAADATQTALVTPSSDETRASGTQSQVTTSVTNDTYQVVATLTCASTAKAITEVGVFSAATGGSMYSRNAFDAINLAVGDSIQFTIKSQYTQA
jgi:hypothetical protein